MDFLLKNNALISRNICTECLYVIATKPIFNLFCNGKSVNDIIVVLWLKPKYL